MVAHAGRNRHNLTTICRSIVVNLLMRCLHPRAETRRSGGGTKVTEVATYIDLEYEQYDAIRPNNAW